MCESFVLAHQLYCMLNAKIVLQNVQLFGVRCQHYDSICSSCGVPLVHSPNVHQGQYHDIYPHCPSSDAHFTVGCQLGIDTSWYYRHRINTESFSFLQIRRPHPCGKHIRSWYCKSALHLHFRLHALTLYILLKDLRIAKELILEKQAGTA